MRRNLFWLSDDQWAKIGPLLPTDVRGRMRVDDRRVLRGILHVLKSGCRWCDCMGRRQRLTTGLYAGPSAGFGRDCFKNLPVAEDRPAGK